MSVGTTPALAPSTAPKRRGPRYKLTVPLHLTVLRSGIPDNIPGCTRELGEGGMGVVVGSQLRPGESVRVEFLLPHMTTPVRATAMVRYQSARGFGLQFLRLPVEQQSVIRYWTRREGEVLLSAQAAGAALAGASLGDAAAEPAPLPAFAPSEDSPSGFRAGRILAVAVPVILLTAVLGWWRWQRGWEALETQTQAQETMTTRPQWRVPAEEMRQRIRHEVPPEYPEDARRAGVQGTVVLDAVVDVDGAVKQVKFVSGPEALSLAAMNAVRWWRYEPYFVNGQPVTIETTVAVDFRMTN